MSSRGVSKAELLTRLEALLPAQLERVLFLADAPESILPGGGVAPGIRAIELIRYFEQQGRLADLAAVLDDTAFLQDRRVARSMPAPVYASAELKALSERLENVTHRREVLRKAGITNRDLDGEILSLRRQLRAGTQLRAGDSLADGRYLLIKQIGRGGFAVVWEAVDRHMQRRVAVKVLHSHLADDEERRGRFFRGAQRMQDLAHPGIVNIFEPHGIDDSFCYFVMELMTGGDLRSAVLENRLAADRVMPLILQIGEALAEAHRHGWIHRDVKPSNIVLDEHGNAKLTDFDLVGTHDTTGGTRTGALGTVVYAAPECLDKPQDATVSADVFSLGMSAIFCFLRRDLLMETFRNPSATVKTLLCPAAVREVLSRAVVWEPERRFANASVLLEALRCAQNENDDSSPAERITREEEVPHHEISAPDILRRIPPSLWPNILRSIPTSLWTFLTPKLTIGARPPPPPRSPIPQVVHSDHNQSQSGPTLELAPRRSAARHVQSHPGEASAPDTEHAQPRLAAASALNRHRWHMDPVGYILTTLSVALFILVIAMMFGLVRC